MPDGRDGGDEGEEGEGDGEEAECADGGGLVVPAGRAVCLRVVDLKRRSQRRARRARASVIVVAVTREGHVRGAPVPEGAHGPGEQERPAHFGRGAQDLGAGDERHREARVHEEDDEGGREGEDGEVQGGHGERRHPDFAGEILPQAAAVLVHPVQ